jgi:hypothetical protein
LRLRVFAPWRSFLVFLNLFGALGSGVTLMHAPTRSALAGLVLAFATLSGAQAWAQEPPRDPAAAEVLFRAGRAAADKSDYETACPKFRESQRLDPAPGTELNIADCEEHRGKLATAWELFTRVARELPATDDRVKIAAARAAALEKRLSRLALTLGPGAPGGTTVRRDDLDVGAASLGTPLPIDPGKHVVVVRAPGRQDRTLEVDVAEGEQKAIEVLPGPAAGDVPKPGDDSRGTRRTLGFVAGGLGAAGVVVFAVSGALVLVKKSTVNQHCVRMVCDSTGFQAAQSGQTLGVVSGASLIAGAVLLGAGAALVLTSGPDRKPATALLPAVGPGGASLSVLHRW